MIRHVGVRGYTLLLCAFIWALIAYGVTRVAGTSIPGTFHDDIPTAVRVALWAVPAAAAAALCRSVRWDWVALGLLIIGPVLRTCSYVTAWLLHMTGHPGDRDGWYAAAFYLALIGIVALAAVSHRQPYLGGGEHHDAGSAQ